MESLLATELATDPGALAKEAIRSNVRFAASNLRHGSSILEQLADNEGLLVVGAEYALETGVVDFFDGIPEP